MPPVRVLAYSHDGYGLGHFRRNLRIAAGLRRERPDVEILLATGASAADQFGVPGGIARLALPPVVKVGDGRYVPEDPARSLEVTMAARKDLLEGAVRRHRPDLLLVDRYPFGLHGELAPALRAFHEDGRGRPAVLGLRDVLDTPERVRREWASAGHSEAIREHYRSVLVYGDPDVYDPVREYALPGDVARRVQFTGYLTDDPLLDGAPSAHAGGPGRAALCVLGGGRDAFPVADAFLSAIEILRPAGWTGLLVTGPYMDVAEVEGLRRRCAAPVLRMVQDAPTRMAASDAVVCMGGYNTVCEVLSLAVPAVIVPRDAPRQEQLIRAERLGARGAVTLLPRERLAPESLARAVVDAAGVAPAETRARRALVRGHGVATAARLLAGLLPAPRRPATVGTARSNGNGNGSANGHGSANGNGATARSLSGERR